MPKIEKSIEIAATPEEVWAFATDVHKWHTWFDGLSEPKSVQGDGGLGTVIEHTITVLGMSLPLKTTVAVSEPGVRWKAEYTGLMAEGSQEFTYVAADGGTGVTLVMEVELSGLAKTAEKMIINAFDQMTGQTLANLKARVESPPPVSSV